MTLLNKMPETIFMKKMCCKIVVTLGENAIKLIPAKSTRARTAKGAMVTAELVLNEILTHVLYRHVNPL